MSINNMRGRTRREFSGVVKQDLITKIVFSGEINRSYENMPKFKVTDSKKMSWNISSNLSVEELLAKDKYKGCIIIPLP